MQMILLFVILTILFLFFATCSSSLSATDCESDDDSQLESAEGDFNELPSTSRFTAIQDSLDIFMDLPGNSGINARSSESFPQHGLRLVNIEEDDLSHTSSEPTPPFPTTYCDRLTDSLDAFLASPQINQYNREERVPMLAFSSLSTAWSENIENDLTPRRYPYGRATWIAVLNEILGNSTLSPAASDIEEISTQAVGIPSAFSSEQEEEGAGPATVSFNVGSLAEEDLDIFEPRPTRNHSRRNAFDGSDPLFRFPGSCEDPDAEKVKKRKEKRNRSIKDSILDAIEERDVPLAAAPLEPIAKTDLPVWLKTQLYLQNRALAFQEQQSKTLVNLKEELDLWSILIQRGICKRDEHVKPLEWVKEQTLVNGSGLEGVIGQFNAQLFEYETYLGPFRNFLVNDADYGNFMAFYLTLPNGQDQESRDAKLLKWFEKIQKILMKMPASQRIASNASNETLKQSLHRKWISAVHSRWTIIGLPFEEKLQLKSYVHKAVAQAIHLEIQRYKFIQLQTRLEEFYKEQLAALPPITAEGIADFAVQPINSVDTLLAKFMEGRHEKNEGVVDENPISTEEIETMISFIQTHQKHTLNYINSFL